MKLKIQLEAVLEVDGKLLQPLQDIEAEYQNDDALWRQITDGYDWSDAKATVSVVEGQRNG